MLFHLFSISYASNLSVYTVYIFIIHFKILVEYLSSLLKLFRIIYLISFSILGDMHLSSLLHLTRFFKKTIPMCLECLLKTPEKTCEWIVTLLQHKLAFCTLHFLQQTWANSQSAGLRTTLASHEAQTWGGSGGVTHQLSSLMTHNHTWTSHAPDSCQIQRDETSATSSSHKEQTGTSLFV